MSTTVDTLVINRDTVDDLLDHNMIEARISRHKPWEREANIAWWTIRRNGKTRVGIRNKNKITIPVKAGLNVYGRITEADFLLSGELNPAKYRLKR